MPDAADPINIFHVGVDDNVFPSSPCVILGVWARSWRRRGRINQISISHYCQCTQSVTASAVQLSASAVCEQTSQAPRHVTSQYHAAPAEFSLA